MTINNDPKEKNDQSDQTPVPQSEPEPEPEPKSEGPTDWISKSQDNSDNKGFLSLNEG